MKWLIVFIMVSVVSLGCGSSSPEDDAKLTLASGQILFSAHHSASDMSASLKLFIMNSDGSQLTQLDHSIPSGGSDFGAPDIEKNTTGSWKIAYGTNGITVYDSGTGEAVAMGGAGATRADFNSGATSLVYQMGASQINIWKSTVDGISPTQLTSVGVGQNAEWPYYNPVTSTILYFATYGATTRHVMNADGSGDVAISVPGGSTVSHLSFKADGSEFLNPQNLTSYTLSTGAVGSINSLKTTTTLMNQLAELTYQEVPSSVVPGQGGHGTFALSTDWSRDGKKVVFDALVQDASTSLVKGIAIFTYDIASDKLSLVYGPEVFDGSRTNNFNYSIYTPKWVP